MRYKLHDLTHLNRMCLSLLALGESLPHNDACNLIENNGVIDFLNSQCQKKKLKWSIGSSTSEGEKGLIHDALDRTHHAYHTDPHCLPDDCDGYIYIAAIAVALAETSSEWVRYQDTVIKDLPE